MKYVMFNYSGVETPIIFPGHIKHSDMARGHLGQVISAGFVKIDITNKTVEKEDPIEIYVESSLDIICYGESTSLGVRARKEDQEIINNCLGQDDFLRSGG